MVEVLAGLGTVAVLAWVYLAFFHWNFWRSNLTLPETSGKIKEWPSVVAVIPARNEEKVLGTTLKMIADQDYPGNLQIILVNDNSDDKTPEVAARIKGKFPIRVVNAPPLKPGWAGKLWALHQGISFIETHLENPDFLWLTDADIRHRKGVLKGLVRAAKLDRRNMVSQMVMLHCKSFWERVFVPAFIYFFELLFPFAAANNDRSARAGAAGGCILLELSWLEKIGGIPAMKNALIDDCTLARKVKDAGGRIWLGFGKKSKSIRPYTFGDFWMTVVRTAYTQLRNSVFLLIGTVLGLVLIFLLPPVLFIMGLLQADMLFAALGGAGWILMAGLFVPTLRLYGLSPLLAAGLPVISALYTAMTVHSAFRHWMGKGGHWKDRSYNFN